VVLIGAELTAAVQREADAALNAHGLIKLRVFSDDRAARETILAALADGLNAAPIQHIGKLLVLWRPVPAKTKVEREDAGPAPRVVKVLKFSKSGNHRPQVKKLTVRGNERLTVGGLVKRAKKRPAQTSTKKKALAQT
ncbi:MAG: YhbY family RNA-binding protein, partial [Aquincola sp.]|nr:YhbY family RNA-binding protein [Aquincola sp.]